MDANVRKLTSDAFKNMSQGQKNIALADIEKIKSTLDLLERGISSDPAAPQSATSSAGSGDQTAPSASGQPGGGGNNGAPANAVAGGP